MFVVLLRFAASPEDPFVAEDVVSAEIVEIAPGMADERLGFLL